MSFDQQQNQQTNRQIKLASRPNGVPTADNFDMATSDIPTPKDNEMLLRTVYLSLDPYMRGRMSDAKSYADPLEVGDVIMGGTVAQASAIVGPIATVGFGLEPCATAKKLPVSIIS